MLWKVELTVIDLYLLFFETLGELKSTIILSCTCHSIFFWGRVVGGGVIFDLSFLQGIVHITRGIQSIESIIDNNRYQLIAININ